MPAQRQDSLLRLLDECAATATRVRELLDSNAVPPDEILRQLRAAESSLLGPHASVLRAVDADSALRILGDARRAAMWAKLLHLEAAAHRRAGDDARAAGVETRASGLTPSSGA